MFNQAQHSGYEGMNTPPKNTNPLFLAKPPLKSKNCPSPPFLAIPYIYSFFKTPPPP